MIRQACCANRSPHWTTVTNIHLQAFTIGRQQHWRQVFSCGTIQQSYKERHHVEVPTFDNDFCKPLAGAEQNHGLCWLHESFVLACPQLKCLPGHPRGVSRWHILIESAGTLEGVSFSWTSIKTKQFGTKLVRIPSRHPFGLSWWHVAMKSARITLNWVVLEL